MPLQKPASPYRPRPSSIGEVERFLGLGATTLACDIGRSIFDEPSLRYAYLGGSIADGFANSKSDLDVYAVYEGRIPAGLNSAFQSNSGRRVQLAATTAENMRKNIAYLNAYDGTAGDLEESRLQFFHRLGRGVPLQGEEAFRKHQREIDWAKFRASCSAYSQFLADNNWEDAAGNRDAGNLDTAVLMAMQASGNALDAISGLFGETAPGRKWRYDKAKRALHTHSPELVERCFRIETSADIRSDQSKHDFLDHCDAVYSGLSDARLLLGLGYQCSQLPVWLFRAPGHKGLYRRHPQSLLRKTLAGEYKIWSPHRGLEDVEPSEVLVWVAACGSSNLDESTERIRELCFRLGRETGAVLDHLQPALDKWRENGHLSSPSRARELNIEVRNRVDGETENLQG